MGCDQVVGLRRTRCDDRVCEVQRVGGASDGRRYWLRRADDREVEAAVVRDACERDVGEHGGVGRERKGSDYIRGERAH